MKKTQKKTMTQARKMQQLRKKTGAQPKYQKKSGK